MNNTAWMAALALVATTVVAQAQENTGVELTGSGFATVGIGRMIGGTRGNVGDYNCPCYISDYAQAGVYDGRSGLQWKPDSKLGLQGTASVDNRRLSLTTQVVARGARDGKVDLEWLYGSYKLTDSVTLQAGRKRIPMFYFSDTQDIGVAFPWTHLPPQLYGWDAVNYNGANILFQTHLGDWAATANLLAGNETFKDSGDYKIYLGRQNSTDVRWKKLIGGDLTLSKDWLETRLVYLQSDTQTKIVANGVWDAATGAYDGILDSDWFPQPAFKQRIYGVAVNADYDKWLVRSELIRIDRPGQNYRDYASLVGVGYRLGKWQPMLTHSRYWGKAMADRDGNPADPSVLEAHYSLALTLRYELTTSSDIKIQFDRQVDQSGPNWGIASDSSSPTGVGTPYGNARLLTVSYDLVF